MARREWMARIAPLLSHRRFLVVIVVLLALWVSAPSFILRYAVLSPAASGQMVQWETLVLLFLPLPGIVATIHGGLTGKRLWSFLLGTTRILLCSSSGCRKRSFPSQLEFLWA